MGGGVTVTGSRTSFGKYTEWFRGNGNYFWK